MLLKKVRHSIKIRKDNSTERSFAHAYVNFLLRPTFFIFYSKISEKGWPQKYSCLENDRGIFVTSIRSYFLE